MGIPLFIAFALVLIVVLVLLFKSMAKQKRLKQQCLEYENRLQSCESKTQEQTKEKHTFDAHRRFLELMIECERLIAHAHTPNDMLDEVIHKLCSHDYFDVAWIGFTKEDNDELPISYFCDRAEPRFLYNGFTTTLDTSDPYANGPTSQAVLTGKEVLIEDTQSDLRFSPWHSRAKFSNIPSVIALPLMQNDSSQPLGALTLYMKKACRDDDPIIEPLRALSHSLTKRMLQLNIDLRNLREAKFCFKKSQVFQQVLDTVPANIFWKDSDLKYMGCNRTYLNYRKLSHFNDLLGKSDYELGWYSANDPQTLEEIAIISKDETITNRVEKDGSNWILSNKKPFSLNENKNERGMVGVHIDISEQHNRILELERREKHYREVIENLPNVALQGFDDRRRITYWNTQSRELFGYSKEEVLGKHIDQLLYPEALRNKLIANIDTWLTQNRPIAPTVTTLLTKEGESIKVHIGYILLDRTSKQPEFFTVCTTL